MRKGSRRFHSVRHGRLANILYSSFLLTHFCHQGLPENVLKRIALAVEYWIPPYRFWRTHASETGPRKFPSGKTGRTLKAKSSWVVLLEGF